MLRDDVTLCTIVDEESGTSELLSSSIKHHLSIAVKLKRLLTMWLTSVMLTPLLLYCAVATVQSASIILLIDNNATLYENSTDSLFLEDTSTYDDENVTSTFNTTNEIITSISFISPKPTPDHFFIINNNNLSRNSSEINNLPMPLSSRGRGKSKVDCMINPSKGFYNPTNVYQCHVTQKCCLEYAKPSCCGSKSTTQIM